MEEIEIQINGEIMINADEKKNEKKAACKTQNFYILPAFLSIIIALLIAVSIHCHLIKHRAKEKNLLPFHDTNNELKQVIY